MVRFFSAAIITLFLADSSDIYAASIVGGGLRHGKKQLSVVRRTLSEECVIVVVKRIDEKVFECELDPSDANGELGTRRALSATPRQMAHLRSLHKSGQLVEGEHLIVHGVGAKYDDEMLYLPKDLSMLAAIMRRGERRLAARLFDGNGNKRNGRGKKDYIVTFTKKDDAGPASKCDALAKKNGGKMGKVFTRVLNGCSVSLPASAINGLQNNPNIALVEEDGVATVSANSWGLDRINQLDLPLDGVTTKVNAAGVKVYIVDTGLRGSHQDFAGMIDETSSCHFSAFEDGLELNEGHGHGTHVGSIACGKDHGVADNCQLCAVRVVRDNGMGALSRVIEGFDHVLADCGPGDPCVVNTSLGGTNAPAAVNEAVRALVNAGVVVVVAAGNDNGDACAMSPASEPLAITVGATMWDDAISGFSNFGNCVDVYAPGTEITAAHHTSNTATNTKSGTSMASPHVAGIAAGILSGNPAYTPAEVRATIESEWTNVGIDVRTPGVGLATIFGARADITESPTNGPTLAPTMSIGPTMTPTLSCSGMDVSVVLTTDLFPAETAWSFTETCAGSGGQRYDGPSYSGMPSRTVVTEMCLPDGRYDFTITDYFEDGICCRYGSGSYQIYVDGVMVHDGNGEFSRTETRVVGSCETESPTGAPTIVPTDSPTYMPTRQPFVDLQFAAYDAALGAPKCDSLGATCTSGAILLKGKLGNLEQNPSNTVDGCADGPRGAYGVDESIDLITVRSVDGRALEAGKRVQFEVHAHAWGDGAADTVEFYRAAEAWSPAWEHVATAYPTRGGPATWVGTYDLPPRAGVHAFRARIRYAGSEGPCGDGNWDDVDDLAFRVAPAAGGATILGLRESPQVSSGPRRDFECASLDEDRCRGADACRWRKGRGAGCFAMVGGKN